MESRRSSCSDVQMDSETDDYDCNDSNDNNVQDEVDLVESDIEILTDEELTDDFEVRSRHNDDWYLQSDNEEEPPDQQEEDDNDFYTVYSSSDEEDYIEDSKVAKCKYCGMQGHIWTTCNIYSKQVPMSDPCSLCREHFKIDLFHNEESCKLNLFT